MKEKSNKPSIPTVSLNEDSEKVDVNVFLKKSIKIDTNGIKDIEVYNSISEENVRKKDGAMHDRNYG